MRTDDFDFELPADRIAQEPARPRDSARLLVLAGAAAPADHIVRDLPDLLRPGDLLVFNDTKVIPARLTGHRGAAKVELTLHRRIAPDTWQAFAKPAKRLRPGDTVVFADDFKAAVLARDEAEVTVQFDQGGAALMAALHHHGALPLPPYIRRPAGPTARDLDDYQTLFAAVEGAVAAPTAGLHFTPALMARLAERGVATAAVTLHVGAGTFLPVKVDDIADHRMHSETGVIPAATAAAINRTRAAGGRIVAVGTTSLRLLESAPARDGQILPFADETAIFITPGFTFRFVDLLLTNFHLPRSTLFMLVSAFAGLARMRTAYHHAIAQGYRFYSYGDASLIERAR
ncbi:MAG: tRNA preQ1(34) S-adenosylmethionine ribosyltransferase-isomerase QueA [Azospirillaceae bacterium]|nr:tRNA preQ1(34) S-adenosylmethionine ribosyltransferase-isomerase QueA [Azospirillaceae bacterium]